MLVPGKYLNQNTTNRQLSFQKFVKLILEFQSYCHIIIDPVIQTPVSRALLSHLSLSVNGIKNKNSDRHGLQELRVIV